MEEHNNSQANGDNIERLQQFYDLLDNAKQLEEKIEQQTVESSLNSINASISTANQLMEGGNASNRVLSTNEAVLDSLLLRQNHELLSKVFQQTTTFNAKMLADGIRRIVFKDNVANWKNMAPYVFNLSSTFYTSPSMLGYVDFEPTQREPRERQQRRRTEFGETTRPSTSSQLKLNEKGGEKGSEKVKHVHKQIHQLFRANGQKPIPYYRLVIDPNDFNNTVQNSFQISFLVRENILGIDVGADGYPQVRLLTSAEIKAGGTGGGQAVCNLNFALCNRMIKHYDIKEPMIISVTENEDEENSDDD